MLGFVRKHFRTIIEVALWLNLLICTIGGGKIGSLLCGTSIIYCSSNDQHFHFIGGFLGLGVGILINIIGGGLIVTFVEIGENIEIIKNKIKNSSSKTL